MGRSNIKQVAEKRRLDIEKFLVSLFRMADEISHSDLVYTFFHPLHRDQEEATVGTIHAAKLKGNECSFHGIYSYFGISACHLNVCFYLWLCFVNELHFILQIKEEQVSKDLKHIV